MKLQHKTILIVSAVICFIFVILYGASRIVLSAGFKKVEQDATIQNVNRVVDAIGENINNLAIKAADWSKWDDTYEFINDKNSEYIESNLTDESLSELNLNLMFFLNKSGEPIFGRMFDLQNDSGFDVRADVKASVLSDTNLWDHSSEDAVVSGILMIGNNPLSIVSRPILTSEGTGPIRGTIIFGRFLDSTEIAKISQITHLSIHIALSDTISQEPQKNLLTQLSDTNNKVLTEPLSETRIAGYTLLNDIHQKAKLLIRIDTLRDIHLQGTKTFQYLAISILISGILFGIVILVLLQKTVVNRVVKLEKDVVAIGETGNHSARVTYAGSDEISWLSKSINSMLGSLENIEQEITKKNVQMSMIMHTVPSGLLSISETNMINPEYSHSVEQILKRSDLVGQDFIEIIGLNDAKMKERNTLIDFLNLIRSEAIPEKDLAGLNPIEEIQITHANGSSNWLKTAFFLIKQGENGNRNILVVLEDITEAKALAQKVKKSEQENLQLKAIVEDTDLFKEFLVEMRQIIDHANKNINLLEMHEDRKLIVNEIFRDVHTMKGTASAFCLNTVTEIAGILEDSLSPLRDTGEISEEMITKTKRSLTLLSEAVLEVMEKSKKILGDELYDTPDIYLKISLQKLKNEADALHAILKQELMNSELVYNLQNKIELELRKLCSVSARKGLSKAIKSVPGLITRLGKEVHFEFEGAEVLIDCEIAKELNTPLLHLLRNCFDHGIEQFEERLSNEKPEKGLVKLSVKTIDNLLCIEIEDDGKGMNPDKLKQAAIDKGFISVAEAALLNDQKALELIFLPGFSTAQNVNDISGRGVGMDAVLESIKNKLRGDIRIDSIVGKGTKFTILIPSQVNAKSVF